MSEAAFVQSLLASPPDFAAELEKPRPRPSSVRRRMELVDGATGGERQARETLIRLYGLGCPHEPGRPLLRTFGEAVAEGQLRESAVQPFLFAHRSDLSRLMYPALRQLQRAGKGFDYVSLYHDLRFHRPATSRRWQHDFLKGVHHETS